ncbi:MULTISPECIES: hypothetical protein [unclassified Kitasatospora]|nr:MULTISPECIES: hypothetical protein [unclassified Kitasatospora]
MGERIAVCAVAASMPVLVLNELERELPALAATANAATTAGLGAAGTDPQ